MFYVAGLSPYLSFPILEQVSPWCPELATMPGKYIA